MKGIPTFRLPRLKRAAVLAGVGGLMVAGVALGSGQAHALTTVLGTDPGAVTIVDTTTAGGNSTSDILSYTTSEACPAGHNGSGTLYLVNPTDPTNLDQLSPTNNSVTAPFSSAFTTGSNTIVKQHLAEPEIYGAQSEYVMRCSSGASNTGDFIYVMDTFVTVSADGTTFEFSNTPTVAAQDVTVTLTASPNPATAGQAVQLTATVAPASATGTIQFENGGTAINGPVTISGGSASTFTTFSGITDDTTENLTAVYTPSGNFNATVPGSLDLLVHPASPNSGNIPLAVEIPQTGAFTLTVDTATWVVLNPNTNVTDATGSTTPIVVTDTRNFYPGWSVDGQATQWHGVTDPASETPAGYPAPSFPIPADHGSQTIPANALGWTPTNVGTLPQGVTLGDPIAPNGNLGDAPAVLASVHGATGNGFTGDTGLTLGADLDLAIPSGTESGPYAAFLDITSVDALP